MGRGQHGAGEAPARIGVGMVGEKCGGGEMMVGTELGGKGSKGGSEFHLVSPRKKRMVVGIS